MTFNLVPLESEDQEESNGINFRDQLGKMSKRVKNVFRGANKYQLILFAILILTWIGIVTYHLLGRNHPFLCNKELFSPKVH